MVVGLTTSVTGVVGFGGMALAMVLTDQGNGVVRISRVCLVAVPLAVPLGWHALAGPLSLRVRDSVSVALGLLGRSPCAGPCCGVCRAVDEVDTEYMVYRGEC